MKFRSIGRWAVFIGGVLLLSACGSAGTADPGADQPEPLHVTVLARPFLSSAPFYIAQDAGYFAEQGIEVEFVNIATDVEAVTATLQNNVDVAGVFLTANLINGIANSPSVRIVADKGYLDPTGCSANGLIASTGMVEAGLSGPEALAGRRVAMAPTTVEGFLVSEFLQPAGLTLDDIEIVEIPTPSELGAIGDGSIDAVAGSEPWMTLISDAGYGQTWIEWEDRFPGFQFGMVMFSKKLIEDQQAGIRFMTAYLKAVRQFNEGLTEDNVRVISGFSGLDPELIRRACWGSFRTDGSINLESIARYQDWAVAQGQVAQPIKLDQIWNPMFIDAANRVLDGQGN